MQQQNFTIFANFVRTSLKCGSQQQYTLANTYRLYNSIWTQQKIQTTPVSVVQVQNREPVPQSYSRSAAIQPRRSFATFKYEVPDKSKISSLYLDHDNADDLIANLKDSERQAIKDALIKYDAIKVKEGFEGHLAATQWRTRFGRMSKVPTLGDVDPTGTFCAFPEDWLKKKAVQAAKQPARADLIKIFFVNAVPFVVFGFLDNFTMIVAGDYIEQSFGLFMCISTMAAAGLGNTISDVLGIGSAVYIERLCDVMGLKTPDLTPAQLEMKASRRSANWGRILGITAGCLIGMFPLMFMDNKLSEHAKKKDSEPQLIENTLTAESK